MPRVASSQVGIALGLSRGGRTGTVAAVVGLLLAAFYNPVWTSAVGSPIHFCLAAIAFLALAWWRVPPWLVVLAAALVTGFGIGR